MSILADAKHHLATYGAAHVDCCGTPLIRKLVAELEWQQQRPDGGCDSKCDWCKRGDPDGCHCGLKEWQDAKPEHLK